MDKEESVGVFPFHCKHKLFLKACCSCLCSEDSNIFSFTTYSTGMYCKLFD